jgi:hypothetical protein
MHHEELDNLYTSPNVISVTESEDEMGGVCNMHGRD